jgi:lipid A 3-O-deacylase
MNAATAEFHALRIFLFLILWLATFACLGVRYAAAQDNTASVQSASPPVGDTVHRSWEVGGFIAGGFPPYYEIHSDGFRYSEALDFFNAGAVAGKMLTVRRGPGFLRGRGEAVVEVIPFWLAYYPKQTLTYQTDNPNDYASDNDFGGFGIHGVSITPLLFRWNFERTESSRFVPWFQLGSGLLWTSKNFPLGKGPGENTSRINFTPQVGFGESIFTKKNQNLDLALKVVHISSAGLGEYNPGVNLTLQFTLGYSWWK